MSRSGSLYIEKDSMFHRLDGSTKFVMLLAWTTFTFFFMDIRIFAVMILLGFGLLKLSKIEYKSIRPLLIFILVFSLLNSLMMLIITPEFGSSVTGKYTVLVSVLGRRLTVETVFYALTLSFKYIAILPITLLFVLTTHPSRFASSLNRMGVSYRVAYAVNIALRYIPDVRDEMVNIMNAQEARGVAFKKGDAGLIKRLQNFVVILVPLLITSLQRIEVVSNAMELRGFGHLNKRSWYNQRKLGKADAIWIAISIVGLAAGIYLKGISHGFWMP